MKGAILYKSTHKEENRNLLYFFIRFLFEPFKSGLFGFAAFFTVLIFATGMSYVFGITKEWYINSDDVLFSLLGFVIVYFIKLSENIKHKSSN